MINRPLDSILETIGNTPTLRVRGDGRGDVFLKLEQFNGGGSVKDRIALGMVDAAEASGLLKPGMTIIESSSGNTAIGLAMIAAVRGYRMVAVCDRHLPAGKRRKLHGLGADIVFLPDTPEGEDTVEIRIAIAKKLTELVPGSVTLLQFDNLVNRETHYRTTGQEIWRDLEGRLDACVVASGTCGTVSGVGQALKEKDPSIRIVGVEPEGSILFGGKPGRYLVQGGGLSFIPGNLDRSVVDAGIKVSDADAFSAARTLAVTHGVMVGGTGGMVVHACLEIAAELGRDSRVVGVIPDSGDRYIDSMYDDGWLAQHEVVLTAPVRPSIAGMSEAARELGCVVNDVGP